MSKRNEPRRRILGAQNGNLFSDGAIKSNYRIANVTYNGRVYTCYAFYEYNGTLYEAAPVARRRNNETKVYLEAGRTYKVSARFLPIDSANDASSKLIGRMAYLYTDAAEPVFVYPYWADTCRPNCFGTGYYQTADLNTTYSFTIAPVKTATRMCLGYYAVGRTAYCIAGSLRIEEVPTVTNNIVQSLTGVTSDEGNAATINRYTSTLTLTYTAQDGYTIPSTKPTVTNAAVGMWKKIDDTHGRLQLVRHNTDADVTITLTGEAT